MLIKRNRLLVGLVIVIVAGTVALSLTLGSQSENGYSAEFVAAALNLSPSSVKSFRSDILNDVFKDYQFFEIYDGGGTIPPQRSIIALDSDGNPLDFNSLLIDANVVIKDEDEALQIAKAFVVYFAADGLSGFILLHNVSGIPYQRGDLKNPAEYVDEVQPPSMKRIDDIFVATLYTWCRDEGILIEWQLEIKDNQLASVLGEVIDVGIGHFTPRTEGVLHFPGYVISQKFTTSD